MNTLTSRHLSHEQLCDVLLAQPAETASPALETAEDHLRNCLICSSELEALRSSIALFRRTGSSYAERVYARPAMYRASIAPSPRFGSHVLYWATAAAIAIAVALPFGLHRHDASAAASASAPAAAVSTSPEVTRSAQSDEALLDGIDQDLSAAVPSALEPLADPTDGTAASSSTQRKN